eukprot:scpid26519/ scgid9512/ 
MLKFNYLNKYPGQGENSRLSVETACNVLQSTVPQIYRLKVEPQSRQLHINHYDSSDDNFEMSRHTEFIEFVQVSPVFSRVCSGNIKTQRTRKIKGFGAGLKFIHLEHCCTAAALQSLRFGVLAIMVNLSFLFSWRPFHEAQDCEG